MEHERTEPVDLCIGRRLNPAARGWARHPMLRANLNGPWGRRKFWDYWNVITDDVIISFVVADIDYVGLASVWLFDRATGKQTGADVLRPLSRGISLPEQACTGTVSVRDRRLELVIDERDDSTALRADAPGFSVGVIVDKPADHESLNVLIPWSDRRFQFTSKQQARAAHGEIGWGDRRWSFGTDREVFAVQDLGRGVWPYSNRWNWAAASGRSTDGRLVGLQFGGKWTEGTGATENGVNIDGRLTKISEEVEWTYDWERPLDPWRIAAPGIDVELRPYHDRYDHTNLGVLKMEVHQVFGTWHGHVTDDTGARVEIEGIDGFAEEARNRW